MKYKSYLLAAVLGVGLMAGVSTASAYTGQGTMKGNDLDITYPIVFTQRPYAQRRINDDLYRLVKDTFDSYADKEFVSAYMDYEVTYEDDNVISLLIHVSRYPDKEGNLWPGIQQAHRKPYSAFPLCPHKGCSTAPESTGRRESAGTG